MKIYGQTGNPTTANLITSLVDGPMHANIEIHLPDGTIAKDFEVVIHNDRFGGATVWLVVGKSK
jgi:hypothetical protein